MRLAPDLHPDDTAARVAIRETLLRECQSRRITRETRTAPGGASVHELARRTNWRMPSIQGWARLARHQLTLTARGLPAATGDVEALHGTAREAA